MKITIVFPRFKTFSGAEHLLLELARYAVEEGHEMVILTRGFDEGCRPHLAPGVEVRIPRGVAGLSGNHLVDSFLDVALSPVLLKHLPEQTDVVCFLCDAVLPAMWLHRQLLRRHLPTVYYCLQPPRFVYDLMSETMAAHRPLGYLIPLIAYPYRVMDRVAARSCDRIFAISEDYAAWCRELYQTPEVRLVYPGVDLGIAEGTRPAWVRERHGLEAWEKLVVTVNKLIARKNLDVYLRAMRIVTDRIPQARGILVGDGPIKPALLKLREELGLAERVVFTGFVPEFADVAHYYAASDVYVFLEKNVPFGLTVLEAAACGKPVVAVRGGGTRETMIHGETGFLVGEELDADEVADRICWLLEHDRERLAMGRAARKHAQGFSWKSRARAFVAALEEVTTGLRTGTATPPPERGTSSRSPSAGGKIFS